MAPKVHALLAGVQTFGLRKNLAAAFAVFVICDADGETQRSCSGDSALLAARTLQQLLEGVNVFADSAFPLDAQVDGVFDVLDDSSLTLR